MTIKISKELEAEQIEEITSLEYNPKVEKLSDEQKEYVVWMFKKLLKKQRKDVKELIDEWNNQEENIGVDLSELKTRIEG